MESHMYNIFPEPVDALGFARIGRDMPYEVVHHDNLESVLGLSGHDGTVLQTISYDPFGNTISTTGSSNNNQLHYTGREQDPDTGLYNYRARIYDPTIGRFITEDPKGFAAGVNFYSYCLGNPVNCNDPYGLINWSRMGWGAFEAVSSGIGIGLAAGAEIESVGAATAATLTVGGILVPKAVHGVTEFIAGALESDNNPIPNIPSATLPALTTLLFTGNQHTANNVDLATDLFFLSKTLSTAAQNDSTLEGVGAAIDSITAIKAVTDPTLGTQSSLGQQPVVSTGSSDTAAGGFLIYPNQPNTNMMQSVYAKPK